MPYSERFGHIEDIGEQTANRCHICHEEAHPDDYGSPAGPLGRYATTVDHIVPQSEGGSDDPENLLLAHAGCNSSRGTRPVEEARFQHAGTTEKPLSTGEELELAVYLEELELAEAREQRVRAIGIGALVVGAVVAVGAGLWWLFNKNKNEQAGKIIDTEASPAADVEYTAPRQEEEVLHTASADRAQAAQQQSQDNTMQPQIDRPTFEQMLVNLLQEHGELPGAQQRILSKLDDAELVAVAGHGRDGLEVWIPGLEAVLDDDGLVPWLIDGVMLHVGGPPTTDWPTSRIDARMDIVSRRPLFPRSS